MALQIRKAERSRAKLRLGMAGPSGSGKTYSSLLMAFGLGGKVGLIDTEHGSGDLYADLGDYDIIPIEAPFTVQKYLEALHAFEDAGYDVIIIDSLTHAWAGEGGLLDKQGKIADNDPRGNSYTAWRKVTPEHNQLVEAMLACKCHLIATVRAKQEYSQEKDDKGKTVVKKLGMAPVQREGMEYEFTVFLDLAMDHTATASKDRTSLFDGQFFKVDKRVAKRLLEWLNTGKEPAPKQPQAEQGGADAGAKVDVARRTQQLEDTTSLFEFGCITLPDLAAAFAKAQTAVKAFAPDLGVEVVRPYLARVIKAKDQRKEMIEKGPQSQAGGDLLDDPSKLTVEDVKRLADFAVNEGLTDQETLEVLGVKDLADLPKDGYAGATEKIMKKAREKVAPPKGTPRRRAAAAA